MPNPLSDKTAIVGVAYAEQVTRHSNLSMKQRTVNACLKAIEDAGLKPKDVDGVSGMSW